MTGRCSALIDKSPSSLAALIDKRLSGFAEWKPCRGTTLLNDHLVTYLLCELIMNTYLL